MTLTPEAGLEVPQFDSLLKKEWSQGRVVGMTSQYGPLDDFA